MKNYLVAIAAIILAALCFMLVAKADTVKPVEPQAKAEPAKAPKMPELSAADAQLLSSIVNDPSIVQTQEEFAQAQKLVRVLNDVVQSKQEGQQLKLMLLLQHQFPEKYKMPGYVYTLDKGWQKKAEK